MLERDDPRYIATVHAVESSLRTGDTVYRYKHEDGLPGEEGGFNLMTSWLIDAKIQIGDLGSPRALPCLRRSRRTDRSHRRRSRPGHRAGARQPPAGVLPPRAHLERPEPRRPRLTVVLVVGLARPGLQLDGTLRHAEGVDLEHLGHAFRRDPSIRSMPALGSSTPGRRRRRPSADGDDTGRPRRRRPVRCHPRRPEWPDESP